MPKSFQMSEEIKAVIKPRCTHQALFGDEVINGQCPFCFADDNPDFALAMLQFFVNNFSFGNVHLYAQKISGPLDQYRFYCNIKHVEFQASFKDFLRQDLLYGCPHCQRLASM